MISGFATSEETKKFSEKFLIENYNSVQNLHLSNVGIGTYLGEPDSESRIKIVSFPYFIAILIDSVKTFFDSKSSSTKRLSITKLISLTL